MLPVPAIGPVFFWYTTKTVAGLQNVAEQLDGGEGGGDGGGGGGGGGGTTGTHVASPLAILMVSVAGAGQGSVCAHAAPIIRKAMRAARMSMVVLG